MLGHGETPPLYVITAEGYTISGRRWVIVRKRGGQQRRITLDPGQDAQQVLAELIGHAVESMRDGPIRDRF